MESPVNAAPSRALPAWLMRGRTTAILFMIYYAMSALSSWLEYYGKVKAPFVALWAVGLIFLIAAPVSIWAGFWSLASRLFRQKTYFFAHLNAPLLSAIVLAAATDGVNALAFAFDADLYTGFVMVMTASCLAVWVLSCHLSLASHFRLRRIVAAAALAVAVLVGSIGGATYVFMKNYPLGPDRGMNLFPARFKCVKSPAPEKHLALFERLKKDADAIVTEAARRPKD
jgi:hypothetical protein